MMDWNSDRALLNMDSVMAKTSFVSPAQLEHQTSLSFEQCLHDSLESNTLLDLFDNPCLSFVEEHKYAPNDSDYPITTAFDSSLKHNPFLKSDSLDSEPVSSHLDPLLENSYITSAYNTLHNYDSQSHDLLNESLSVASDYSSTNSSQLIDPLGWSSPATACASPYIDISSVDSSYTNYSSPESIYPNDMFAVQEEERLMPNTQRQNSPETTVPNDPRLWCARDIRNWIDWARKELSVSKRATDHNLPTTGSELCHLTCEEIERRVGWSDGKQLADHLNILLSNCGECLPTESSTLDCFQRERLSAECPYETLKPVCQRLTQHGSGQIQLWQFLLELLTEPANACVITWEGTAGEFKILEPDEVAHRWGNRKSKPNMNYDKLSRALRYYYDRNLMTKVPGKRYAYKFHFRQLEILHTNQQGGEGSRPTPDIAFLTAALNTASVDTSRSVWKTDDFRS